MPRVGVIFGGRSGEHEVSLASAASVIAALKSRGHRVVPIGIARDGRWVVGGDPMRALAEQARGALPNGDIILIDEVLTPDSSRFWPRDGYAPGGAQKSFDKQFVRDYLERIRWNKQPPVPSLPDEVVAKTREKYVEAFRRLTGQELE